ncbi:MAG: GntR family transcriptional regulator [Chloroflexota bacterium]|nr:GntR family transcriptional regulator [Chloroflexota bacterium]
MDDSGNRTGRRVFREDVKEFLLDAILGGDLKPGDRIVETRVAQQVGVSQGPVREALRDLELFGFVVSEPFRGTRVREITPADLIEVYPIRAALEGVAARVAARHMDGGAIRHLESCLGIMRQAAISNNRKSHIEADIQFHRFIILKSGNRMLLQMWESTRLSSSTIVTVALSHRTLLELADRHVDIIDALAHQDPELAETVMRSHIEELATWIADDQLDLSLSPTDKEIA